MERGRAGRARYSVLGPGRGADEGAAAAKCRREQEGTTFRKTRAVVRCVAFSQRTWLAQHPQFLRLHNPSRQRVFSSSRQRHHPTPDPALLTSRLRPIPSPNLPRIRCTPLPRQSEPYHCSSHPRTTSPLHHLIGGVGGGGRREARNEHLWPDTLQHVRSPLR